MKGLLLKELYTVKSMWKYILFIAIVFSLSFWGRGDGTLAAMFSFVSTILLITPWRRMKWTSGTRWP